MIFDEVLYFTCTLIKKLSRAPIGELGLARPYVAFSEIADVLDNRVASTAS